MTKGEQLKNVQAANDPHEKPLWEGWVANAEARRRTEALREERELAKLDNEWEE